MSRSRRSKSQVSAAAEGISVLDKLVLAQSVWEVGPSSWLKISRMLGKHPLLSHPKTFFTAQSCHAMYNHIMKESGFELSDTNNVAHAPTHLKLAQKYYAERVEELRTLITAEEQQFKAIVAEIDQIRAGQRDEEVEARITGISTPEREAEGEGGEATIAEGPEAVALEESAPVDTSNLISDEPPEVDMPVAEPHTSPQEEEITPSVAPPPSPPDASMEDVETRPEATTSPPSLCVESPPPEALSSPPENLDHLMQASDDESPGKPQTDDVPLPVLEEPVNVVPEQAEEMEQTKETQQAAEDEAEFMNEARPLTEDLPMETSEAVSAAPVEELTSELVDDVQVEVEVETETADEEMDRSQSKLESDDVSAPETVLAKESISTRRSTRRRPSISLTPTPVPGRKRGRPPLHRSSPEPEPEGEGAAGHSQIPAASTKDTTPAAEETQLEDEVPLASAVRRREGKRKASFFGGLDSPRLSKRAREDSEPVDDDDQGSGSAVLRRRPTGRTEEQVALKRFQTVITMVHSQISQHRNGNIFHNPIKVSEAPDYHDIVKRPIDLKTIKAKIKDGVIGNSLEYQRDICLMFANAMMYNRPGSDVHVMAEDMMVESDSHINTFRQTEGYVRGSRS